MTDEHHRNIVIMAVSGLVFACATATEDAGTVTLDAAAHLEVVVEDALAEPSDASEPLHVLLAHNAAWQTSEPDSDPFELAAAGVRCADKDFAVETIDGGTWFDILTADCDHATVQQTTLTELAVGDTLLVWIWHYAMDHEGGDFTARLALGESAQTVWETTLPVPAQSGLIYEELTVAEPWPAGSTLWFHLSNHGDNTWSVVEFEVQSRSPVAQSSNPSSMLSLSSSSSSSVTSWQPSES